MEWESSEQGEDGSVRLPERWVHLHYYEAFNILFRIENALRLFVYVVLKNEYKSKWADLSIVSEDGDGTIASVASKRRHQAGTFGYLGYPVSSPLLYLTTGELLRLITSDAYWKSFRSYFPGAKNTITTKFDELNSVRNALAHFRPIKLDDVDTIKQSSKHVLTTVEQALANILECSDSVPTNSSAVWYTELRVLGTAHTKLQFHQSVDETWIRVDIVYACPILSSRSVGPRYHQYSVLTASAPSLLRTFSDLRANVTYAAESVGYVRVGIDGAATFSKRLSFGFGQQVLETNSSSIRGNMEQVLSLISEETELIQQDNLARGKIVRAVQTHVVIPQDKDFTFASQEDLLSGFREDDPAEWWGSITLHTSDFISSTHRYPWMPTDVAKQVFPF